MTESSEAPQPRRGTSRRAGYLLMATAFVVVTWWLLQMLGLGKAAFHTKGEPREAIVVADILQRGEWILPRRNAIELPAKPPLFHWLGALTSYGFGGISELTVRLPSALQSLAAALLVMMAGTRLYGARCGLVAALVLLSSFEWLRAATSARIDMTLAFGLTCAFVGLLMLRESERAAWRYLVYLGLTWAALAKGPVGVALPVLQLVLMCALDRSAELLRRLRPIRAFFTVLFLAGAWYVAATATGGYAFFAKQVLDENVYRFLGSRHLTGGHRHSVWYLAGMLLIGFLPWTLFLPSIVAGLWRGETQRRARDPRTFVVAWAALVFAFYAIPASKRGVYLLPMYPALALLLALQLDTILRAETDTPRLRVGISLGGVLLTLVCGAAALVAIGHAASVPVLPVIGGLLPDGGGTDFHRVASLVSSNAWPLAVFFSSAALASLVTFLAARNDWWRLSFAGIVLTVCLLSLSVRLVILPEIANQRTRKNFVAEIRTKLSDPSDLAAYRSFDYGMVYYWRRPMPVEEDGLSASGPRYLVMSEAQWARLEKHERRVYERIPGLESERGGNLGRLVVVQRIEPSASVTQ